MILPHLFESPGDFQQVTDSECYQYFNDNPSQIFSMQILKKQVGQEDFMLCCVEFRWAAIYSVAAPLY